jgi:hypothetical protein
MQADQTMKAVTVGYFQLQHTLTASCPVQFQTLCESSRLYEPGSQYMKFVKRLPQPQITRFSERDPFCFEPYTEGLDNVLSLEKQRKVGHERGAVRVTSLIFWLLSDLSFACVITIDLLSSLILSVAKVVFIQESSQNTFFTHFATIAYRR